jgi:hypothetical protein
VQLRLAAAIAITCILTPPRVKVSPDKGKCAMDSIRFYALAVGLFFAIFLGGKWLLTPTIVPLKPDARLPTFQRVDPDDPRTKIEQTSVSDNDATRDRLRNEVLDYAKAVHDDPCNEVLKKNYIKAVVAYARAWISIVPCIGTQTCRNADSPLLERAQHAFGTPLDNRVREAMRSAHARATFGTGDFPKDTVNLVANLAADGSINSAHPMPEFRHVKAQLDDDSTRQDCGR